VKETLRHRVLVCYDVREPKRLRRTHRTLLGYGDPLQYSVFICHLSRAEQTLLELALRDVIDLAEDTVHLIDLGPATGMAARRIRALGQARVPSPPRHRIV
jgi:CRISPR-associated protein Cas2